MAYTTKEKDESKGEGWERVRVTPHDLHRAIARSKEEEVAAGAPRHLVHLRIIRIIRVIRVIRVILLELFGSFVRVSSGY